MSIIFFVFYCDVTVVLRISSEVLAHSLREWRGGCGVSYRSAEGAKELFVANQVG